MTTKRAAAGMHGFSAIAVALTLGGCALIMLGLNLSYPSLILCAALLGLANSVYHPCDYAILSAHMDESRMGRAFSIHTFAGFLGEHAKAKLGMEPKDVKVALIHEDGPYGVGVAAADEAFSKQVGVQIVLKEGYSAAAFRPDCWRASHSPMAASMVMNTAPSSISFWISRSSIIMRWPRPMTCGWKV